MTTSILFNLAFGYLLGLAVLGYLGIWVWIRLIGQRWKRAPWVANLLVAAHFTVGASSIVLLPAFLVHKFKDAEDGPGATAFAITIFGMLCITFIVGREWNRGFFNAKENITASPSPEQ